MSVSRPPRDAGRRAVPRRARPARGRRAVPRRGARHRARRTVAAEVDRSEREPEAFGVLVIEVDGAPVGDCDVGARQPALADRVDRRLRDRTRAPRSRRRHRGRPGAPASPHPRRSASIGSRWRSTASTSARCGTPSAPDGSARACAARRTGATTSGSTASCSGSSRRTSAQPRRPAAEESVEARERLGRTEPTEAEADMPGLVVDLAREEQDARLGGEPLAERLRVVDAQAREADRGGRRPHPVDEPGVPLDERIGEREVLEHQRAVPLDEPLRGGAARARREARSGHSSRSSCRASTATIASRSAPSRHATQPVRSPGRPYVFETAAERDRALVDVTPRAAGGRRGRARARGTPRRRGARRRARRRAPRPGRARRAASWSRSGCAACSRRRASCRAGAGARAHRGRAPSPSGYERRQASTSAPVERAIASADS